MYKVTLFCGLFLVSFYRVGAMTITENKCDAACPFKSELNDCNKRNAEFVKKIMEDQADVMLFAQLVGSKVNRKDKQDIINQLIKNSSQLELVLALGLVPSKKVVHIKTVITCAKKALQGIVQHDYSLFHEDAVAAHEYSLKKEHAKTVRRLNQEKKGLLFIVNELHMQIKEKNRTINNVV